MLIIFSSCFLSSITKESEKENKNQLFRFMNNYANLLFIFITKAKKNYIITRISLNEGEESQMAALLWKKDI